MSSPVDVRAVARRLNAYYNGPRNYNDYVLMRDESLALARVVEAAAEIAEISSRPHKHAMELQSAIQTLVTALDGRGKGENS